MLTNKNVFSSVIQFDGHLKLDLDNIYNSINLIIPIKELWGLN